ncbi:MAG: hypothetical protein IPK82_44295 [Polyangiaceae bacterium]|nr:hypothetical protein [Polyangiaceae bacterium]
MNTHSTGNDTQPQPKMVGHLPILDAMEMAQRFPGRKRVLFLRLDSAAAAIVLEGSSIVRAEVRSDEIAVGPFRGRLVWSGRQALLFLAACGDSPVSVEIYPLHEQALCPTSNVSILLAAAMLEVAMGQDMGVDPANVLGIFEPAQAA